MRQYGGERLTRMAQAVELVFRSLKCHWKHPSIVRYWRISWFGPHGTISVTSVGWERAVCLVNQVQ